MKVKVKLKDIALIKQGKAKRNLKSIWLLNLDMVESETGDIIDYQYVASNKIGTSTCQFDTTNVLYSKLRPYLNKVVLPDREGFATSEMLPLKPDITKLKREYLAYYLRSPLFVTYISEKVAGAKMPRARTEDLMNARLSLPSLSQQMEITNILNIVTSLISLRKQQLAKLGALVKSQFIEMFGDPIENPMRWDKTKLVNLSELITKGASPTWQGYKYTDNIDQTLFVTSENVREGYIVLDPPKYVEDTFNEKQKRSMLKRGDFLINIVGASIGRAAQFAIDTKANLNQAVALVRLNSLKINEDYLLYYLNSPKALQMYESMQVSVARANLSLQNISDLEILLPPLEIQNQFATFVQQVDKSKFEVQKSLDKLQTMKQALMQQYFG